MKTYPSWKSSNETLYYCEIFAIVFLALLLSEIIPRILVYDVEILFYP